MTRILFVCHGNICRSPMAEYILRDMIHQLGQDDRFEVASAAVSSEEIGNPIYPPAKRELQKHGINCSEHLARQITTDDYYYFDRIYYMDDENAAWLRRLLPQDPDKIRKLLNRDVDDPWYTGDFHVTWFDLEEGCQAIMEEFL